MKTDIYYLKEELKKASEYVEKLTREIGEEEKRTTKLDVRVVLETRGFGEWDTERVCLAHLDLTLWQRNKLIQNLAWLRKDYA